MNVVGICNMALGHIANSAELTAIDPPDGSAEADHCARFYPAARDLALAGHMWSFATVRKYLAELATNPMGEIWAYAYQLPNHMLRPIALLMDGESDDSKGQAYRIETLEDGSGVIYTNVEDAILKYIYRQEDPTRYTPHFSVGLSTLLGSLLAGPLAKDLKLKQGLRSVALAELTEAAGYDKAQKLDLYKNFVPAQLVARNS